jgi:hypothetical protein
LAQIAILCQLVFIGTAFHNPMCLGYRPRTFLLDQGSPTEASYVSDQTQESNTSKEQSANDKNTSYIESLIEKFAVSLDKWILAGNPVAKESAYNIFELIEAQANNPEQVERAVRLARRAGLPENKETEEKSVKKELGRTDDAKRKEEAEQRKRWESERSPPPQSKGRSALSRRESSNDKPDLFLSQIDANLRSPAEKVASDKADIENMIKRSQTITGSNNDEDDGYFDATVKVSALVARAGSESAFDGETLGIGGLDDVLSQVKRRVWIPLAAPPQLLKDLGIQPVRGLLLYGKPGCGKTLLARNLGKMLSPLRPITVVRYVCIVRSVSCIM